MRLLRTPHDIVSDVGLTGRGWMLLLSRSMHGYLEGILRLSVGPLRIASGVGQRPLGVSRSACALPAASSTCDAGYGARVCSRLLWYLS
jgi:hypothetical protein